MIDSTAAVALVTHMLCWTWGICFPAAASSENDQGSMNFASNTAPVPSTMPSSVAAIQRITGWRTQLWTSLTTCPVALMKAIQLRMARAAIGWGVRELAEKAGVTANTVTRIENGADAKQSTMDRLQSALEAAGVEFTNGDQPGVRLTKLPGARSAEPPSASSPTVAAKT